MTERVWNGCAVPDDRLYDLDRHVWVQIDGEDAVLGMTDVGQTMGGRVVSMTWKKPGRQLTPGATIAVIESAKWVGPFPSPLTGELLEVNRPAYEADIAIGNRDPYGAGWMARIRPADLAAEQPNLADGAAAYEYYRAFTDEHEVRCFRCAE